MSARRILVVEDNPLNLKLVRDVLIVSGFEVVAAPSGEEGVTLAETCDPDLVLLDVSLPGRSGLETEADSQGSNSLCAVSGALARRTKRIFYFGLCCLGGGGWLMAVDVDRRGKDLFCLLFLGEGPQSSSGPRMETTVQT